MAQLNARLALAAAPALALLPLGGTVLAQKQILQDRPVTQKTLLDRIQIEDFLTRYYYTWQPREHRRDGKRGRVGASLTGSCGRSASSGPLVRARLCAFSLRGENRPEQRLPANCGWVPADTSEPVKCFPDSDDCASDRNKRAHDAENPEHRLQGAAHLCEAFGQHVDLF